MLERLFRRIFNADVAYSILADLCTMLKVVQYILLTLKVRAYIARFRALKGLKVR